MDKLLAAYQWVVAHGAMILAILLGISEALDQIPWVKASSICQAIINGLKWVKDKFFPAQTPSA